MKKNNNIKNKKPKLIFISGDLDEAIENTFFKKETGYAGFKNKEELKEFLKRFGYSNEHIQKNKKEKIKKIILKAFSLCKDFLKSSIFVFICPTSDNFIRKKMGGVSGITSYKNSIIILINPSNFLTEYLIDTIIHESAHIISGYNMSGDYNLKESLYHEGIAENFTEYLTKRRKPWNKVISKEESKRIFNELKPNLKRSDLHEYVFFGGGKYPNWAGYTISYYIIKEYLKKTFGNKKVDWKEIFRKKPEEVIK